MPKINTTKVMNALPFVLLALAIIVVIIASAKWYRNSDTQADVPAPASDIHAQKTAQEAGNASQPAGTIEQMQNQKPNSQNTAGRRAESTEEPQALSPGAQAAKIPYTRYDETARARGVEPSLVEAIENCRTNSQACWDVFSIPELREHPATSPLILKFKQYLTLGCQTHPTPRSYCDAYRNFALAVLGDKSVLPRLEERCLTGKRDPPCRALYAYHLGLAEFARNETEPLLASRYENECQNRGRARLCRDLAWLQLLNGDVNRSRRIASTGLRVNNGIDLREANTGRDLKILSGCAVTVRVPAKINPLTAETVELTAEIDNPSLLEVTSLDLDVTIEKDGRLHSQRMEIRNLPSKGKQKFSTLIRTPGAIEDVASEFAMVTDVRLHDLIIRDVEYDSQHDRRHPRKEKKADFVCPVEIQIR